MSDIFDFIIVGAGPAGSVVAADLAASAKRPSVLLLEAGGEGLDTINRRPYDRFMNAFALPHLDHGYATIPQDGLGGRVLQYQRGKGLGGSTMINFLVYTRGPAADWDRWAKLVDDRDWEWKKIKERFRQIETFHDKVDEKFRKYVNPDASNHGYSGPLHISVPETEMESDLLNTLLAGIELGLVVNLDVNSGDEMGISVSNVSMANGTRSTAEAFLIPHPQNLTIWTHSRVAKVLMEGTTAVGVQTIDGKTAHASREIILSAGGIDSPKLLLLSGIGPSEELQKVGIDTIHHLPGVGKNASDHLSVIICDMMGPGFSARSEFAADDTAHPAALKMWNESRAGPFAFHMKDSAVMFGKDPLLEQESSFQALSEEVQTFARRPDVPNWEIATGGPLIPPTFVMPPEQNYTSHVVVQMNPQSRGEITLRSNNPEDHPLIDPKYLSNPYDKVALIAAIKAERRLMKTKSMQSYYKMPICAPASEIDEDIEDFIQAVAGPLWHFSTTAKMGKPSDETAVVDSNFKVFGIKNLRVADVSICPFNPDAHTQAVAYVVGKTAAEKLIREYRLHIVEMA